MPGETTELKIPWPAESDEANQGATKIKELAERVDLLLRKQLTKLMEVAKLKVTETAEAKVLTVTETLTPPAGFALVATGNAYSALTEVANNTEIEPSATRFAAVSMTIRAKAAEASSWELLVGGVKIAEVSGSGAGASATEESFFFLVPPGKKWKVKYGAKNEKLKASTLLL